MTGETKSSESLFYSWAIRHGYIPSQLEIGPDGEYLDSHAQAAFEGWSARRPAHGETGAQETRRLAEAMAVIEKLENSKKQAYWERNRLVAILARLYPSGRAVTNIEGWDAQWHNCIYIDSPKGQLSWHIHDDEMVQFASLPEYSGTWDGHTTEEKYRRLLVLLLDLESSREALTRAEQFMKGER